MTRLWGRVAAGLAAVVVVGLAAAPALAAGPHRRSSDPAGVATGPDRLSLVGQSTSVGPGGTWSLHLDVSSNDPAGDALQVAVYPALTTRSAFDAAVDGDYSGAPWYARVPLRSAPVDPAGGVLVRVPVDRSSRRGDTAELDTSSGSAVYPVHVRLVGAAGRPLGPGLSTFLVYDGGTGGFYRLAVSLVASVGAAPALTRRGQAGGLSAATVAHLSSVVSTLGATTLPLSLSVTPQTVQALDASGRAGRAVTSSLAGLVSGGDELLAAPYVSASLSGLEASGLGDQVGAQIAAGRSALASALGVTPSSSTWVLDGPLGAAALRTLRAAGLTRLVVPGADLSALPAALQTTTFAKPAALDDGSGSSVQVVGADPILSGRLGRHGQPVLAAEQDLAELAMIQLETPSVRRGVAILLPEDVTTAWLRTFLAGLAGDPFARAVTVAGLFSSVPTLPAGDGGPVVRTLVGGQQGVAGAGKLLALDGQIGVLGRLVPSDAALLAGLGRQLLLAESSQLDGRQRASALAAAEQGIAAVERRITLPASTSVTLTARSATLPVTVESDPGVRAHVVLWLDSPELAFGRLVTTDGSCSVGASGENEVCDLVVHAAAVTLRFPVTSRSSGVYPLDVDLLAPGGDTLATERDTIRSTAVSFVGLVLIIGAALSLGAWWVRNIRHGRRARRLVPPPGGDPGEGSGGGPGPGGGAPTPLQPEPDGYAEGPGPGGRPLEPAPAALTWTAGEDVTAPLVVTPGRPATPSSARMSPSGPAGGPNQ